MSQFIYNNISHLKDWNLGCFGALPPQNTPNPNFLRRDDQKRLGDTLKCKVVLHSIFRQKLPPDSKGEVSIEIADSSTLADIMLRFDLPPNAVCVVNNQLEENQGRNLKDGDILHIFHPAPVW
jgi:hypothetical protein